ncbi:MAG: putative drug exporter of the superfamily [Thermoleophilaceae bacterium]|jgi:RND superfamily putative drug exporter|nr:putative drug exporter of the superfamily [Thermoleophilaceae bacterium]
MQSAMDRLAGFLERRRWLVLAAWLLLLLAALPFAAKQTEHLTSGGFQAPGSQSQVVDENIARFDGAQREHLAVVLARRPGATTQAVREEIDRAAAIAKRLPNVAVTPRAVAAAKREAGSASITVLPLEVSGDEDAVADAAVDFHDELGTAAHGGAEPHLVGQQALWAGMQDLTKKDLESAEKIGFPVVLLILLAVFGSLAAAALPLALGFASVSLTGGVIYFLSQATPMSVFVTNIASMIGIGVAVDYSLFVLARYREEIRRGADRVEARRIALRTSGLAVTFSGITVMLSLAGLFLVDSTTIRSMAMGAIIVVAVSILAAVTLLPVLMNLLGKRAYARGRLGVLFGLLVRMARTRRRRPGSTRAPRQRVGFWERWTDAVTRRPWVSAVGAAAVLLALAVPALSLDFGNGALRQFPKEHETRVGAELAAQKAGSGSSGPLQVIAELRDGGVSDTSNSAALSAYVRELSSDREVAQVAPPQPSRDGRAALVTVLPRHDPESPAAEALVDRMRADAGPLRGVADVQVGGATAFNKDFIELVSGSMWKILLFVLVFSYIVLFLLLRSVLLPLKAVLMNLLSVAAAYGVLVMVFQYGWFDGLLGYDSLGYVNAMTPPFLLAIVFGLSMDYEVFLLSRIRESYDVTGDSKRSVAEGLRASAGTISSAALIMVAVFAVFAGTGTPSIKEIGVGMSVAIALDATLVRLILVPATMELMGRWNWWLPKRVDRVLPHAGFEGRSASPQPALDLRS